MDNGYRILVEELLRENRFYYEIIVAESAPNRGCTVPRSCTSARCTCRPAARTSWPSGNACCGKSRKPWAGFEQARQALPPAKVQEVARQVQWITALLA